MTADTSPGWDAIDAALADLYPGVKPVHHGPALKYAAGGGEPLDGISFYPRDDHWHLVSYGMSELYGKEWDDPTESGWGLEFTMRVARAAGEPEPPLWAAGFLQNLARNVFARRLPYTTYSHFKVDGPIATARPGTAISAVGFVEDAELGTIDTPHGKLQFLQVVGLTAGEEAIIDRWHPVRLMALLSQALPLHVTDLDRADLAADPQFHAAVEEGIQRDGSWVGSLPAEKALWRNGEDGTSITLDAASARRVGALLPFRLPYGRPLEVNPISEGIRFQPGDDYAATVGRFGALDIQLPPAAAAELAAVLRQASIGVHTLTAESPLEVHIVAA